MNEKEIILKFFEITGNTRDSEIFLKNFRSQSPEKFALIYASTDALSDSFLSFLYDLKFLYSLNLFPSVVIDKRSEDYLKIFYDSAYNELNSSKNFSSAPIDVIRSNGNASDEIRKSVFSGKVPILILKDAKVTIYDYLGKLANELLVNKLIILRENSGLKEKNTSRNISMINLETDFEKLVGSNVIEELDRPILMSAKSILDNSKNSNLALAITSPVSLLKELFTIKGSGTFIKKGSKILLFEDYSNLDSKKLKSLVESAFGKKVRDDFFHKKIQAILVESNYRGAAIFQDTEFGTLLSKFAVDEIARGEGIGRDIWDKMKSEFTTIFWRANPKNSINSWYQKECEGFQKYENWNIYWIGLDVSKVANVCKYLASLSIDFID